MIQFLKNIYVHRPLNLQLGYIYNVVFLKRVCMHLLPGKFVCFWINKNYDVYIQIIRLKCNHGAKVQQKESKSFQVVCPHSDTICFTTKCMVLRRTFVHPFWNIGYILLKPHFITIYSIYKILDGIRTIILWP